MQSIRGFTLIELSLVLVIIGSVVGGILVGRDLIKASEIRTAIRQIEQFDLAANTFRMKYNGLPGDLRNAATFGFDSRSIYIGNGNGIIEATVGPAPQNYGGCGEAMLFWDDLSTAGLIPNEINFTGDASGCYNGDTLPPFDSFLPAAKIGQRMNYMIGADPGFRASYYLLARITEFDAYDSINLDRYDSLTPLESFQIDTKIDDGKANSGKVMSDIGNMLAPANGNSNPTPTAYCYDSDDGAYSMSTDAHANTPKCILRIKTSF